MQEYYHQQPRDNQQLGGALTAALSQSNSLNDRLKEINRQQHNYMQNS